MSFKITHQLHVLSLKNICTLVFMTTIHTNSLLRDSQRLSLLEGASREAIPFLQTAQRKPEFVALKRLLAQF
jgi:hypothetical protein